MRPSSAVYFTFVIVFAACSFAACSDDTPPPAMDLAVSDLPEPMDTTIAAAQTLSTCLAVDATSVYWADQGGGMNRVLSAPIAGGAPVTLATGGDAPGCVVVDATYAYFTEGDAMMAVPKDGSGPAQAIATGQHFLPQSGSAKLFAQGGYVFWVTDVYGAVDAYNGMNAIVRVKPSSAVEVMFAGVYGNPGALAVDDNNYYYTDTMGAFAQPRAGGNAHALGSSALHLNPLRIDAQHVAVVEIAGQGQGDVAVMNLDGSARVLASMTLAASPAIDETGVYARETNKLVRYKLDGSETRTLAEASPHAIALDATYVYFSNGASIQRVPKP